MAKLNVKEKKQPIYTEEGGRAVHINYERQLRRSVMSCMLWENEFYEDGETIADRIKNIIPKVSAEKVAQIAIECRESMKLRHAPLLIVREMARLETHRKFVADTLEKIIQRADELTEFLAIYWKDGKEPLSAQVKKGLARAFTKFNEYELAKYNNGGTVKLRDVLFLCHAKPKNKEQVRLWKKLVDNKLKTPDTWEVSLSAGKDKKATFTRLIKEEKLGALAILRNLRNMINAGVSEKVIISAISNMKTDRVLPFRFISASRYAPGFESNLEETMFKCLEGMKKLKGKTVLLVDVSGSMEDKLSDKSEMTRMDAACGLAVLCREICDNVDVYTFSNECKHIASRRGMALKDAIENSQSHSGTELGAALDKIKTDYDRIIVFTDEQSHDDVHAPKTDKGYIINIASNKNGVGYGKWNHINGFSENVLNYIRELEEV